MAREAFQVLLRLKHTLCMDIRHAVGGTLRAQAVFDYNILGGIGVPAYRPSQVRCFHLALHADTCLKCGKMVSLLPWTRVISRDLGSTWDRPRCRNSRVYSRNYFMGCGRSRI